MGSLWGTRQAFAGLGFCGSGGFADDELGSDDDFRGELFFAVGDAFEEHAGTAFTHFCEWLAHGGKGRRVVSGRENVVEADHGDVAGHGRPTSLRARMAPMA